MTSGSDICLLLESRDQPPCRARTISTLSPGLSGVSRHAARGTTAPLSATAMPRWPVSTAFSANSASIVAASERLALAVDADVRFAHRHVSLLRGPRRQKPLEAERADRRIDDIIEDEARHGVRRYRREQDAVAVVAGGIKQAFERPAAEDRRIVAAARADGRPRFPRSATPRPPAPRATRLQAASAYRRR